MTDIAPLLASLREKGVKLWVEDGNVKCSAPVGVLDPATRATLSTNKDAIKSILMKAQSAKALSALVPINPGRPNRPPLFVVSGHGGDVFYLLQLARHLDPDQPVFGVRPWGLSGANPMTSVEAIAEHEIEQIRRHSPTGPYLIAGHCAGGTIAFEVAQQLTAKGESVAFLGLVGSPFPTMFRRSAQTIDRIGRLVRAMTTGTLSERKQYLKTKLQGRLRRAEETVDADGGLTAAARQRVENATMAAVRSYRPAYYGGEIDLFITADTWHRSHRWRDLAGTIREHHIPDHEIDELLLGPSVAKLATLLQTRLHRTIEDLRWSPLPTPG